MTAKHFLRHPTSIPYVPWPKVAKFLRRQPLAVLAVQGACFGFVSLYFPISAQVAVSNTPDDVGNGIIRDWLAREISERYQFLKLALRVRGGGRVRELARKLVKPG